MHKQDLEGYNYLKRQWIRNKLAVAAKQKGTSSLFLFATENACQFADEDDRRRKMKKQPRSSSEGKLKRMLRSFYYRITYVSLILGAVLYTVARVLNWTGRISTSTFLDYATSVAVLMLFGLTLRAIDKDFNISKRRWKRRR